MDLRETVFRKTELFLCHCEDHLTGISYYFICSRKYQNTENSKWCLNISKIYSDILLPAQENIFFLFKKEWKKRYLNLPKTEGFI